MSMKHLIFFSSHSFTSRLRDHRRQKRPCPRDIFELLSSRPTKELPSDPVL